MEINLNFIGLDNLILNNIELYQIGLIFIFSFIIIYLVRPKSVKKVIPSLMFLISNKKKGKLNSFLKKLLIDPLFLLHLLIILLLLFAMFMPKLSYEYDLSDENTIFVIDVSASMNANNRFNEIKEIVKENAKGSISTVLIKNNPEIFFEDEIPNEAINLINTLKPTVSPSNIVDAIKIADDLMKNKTGRIIVISDFKDNYNSYDDLLDLKNFLESKERIIEYHVLEPKENNIGFIDYQYSNEEITLFIKNFNHEKTNVTINVYNELIHMELMPQSVDFIRFEPPPGTSSVNIIEQDDFMLDNTFYINVPSKTKKEILLVTNNVNTYLHAFLRSSPYIDLNIVQPPNIPNKNYDIIILDNVRQNLMLNRIKETLQDYVSEGGSLVITRSGDIDQINIDNLLPVELINQIIPSMQTNSHETFTEDLFFGRITNFRNARLKHGSAPILDGNEGTLIAYFNYENGNVLYYGIPERNSDFHFTTTYPLFWNRVLRFMINFNEFENYNVKTNERGFENNVGFIEKGNNIFAVNLLNEIESDVTSDREIINFIEESQFERQSKYITKYWNLNYIIISLILLLLLLELLFIKYRGDL